MKNKLIISMGSIWAMALPAIAVISCGSVKENDNNQNDDTDKIDSWTKENTIYHNKVLTIKSSATEVKLGYYANKEIDKIVFEDPSKITSLDKNSLKGFSLSSKMPQLSQNGLSFEEISDKIDKLEEDPNVFYISKNGGYLNLNIFTNLKRIEKGAFENFNLSYLSMDELKNLDFIGEYAFKNSSIELLNFDGVRDDIQIGKGAFESIRSGAKVRVSPKSMLDKEISNIDFRDSIFGKYKNLHITDIGDSHYSAGGDYLRKIEGLRESDRDQRYTKFIAWPPNLEIINDGAFAGSVVKGEVLDLSNTNIKSIGNNAFGNISFFSEIIIPDTIASIGKNAFVGSGRTTKVKISQSKWDELIKGRELEIFGKNGNHVTRI